MKLSSIKVLVVEDDRNVLATLRMMLGEMGISDIHEASNGLEGLSYLNEIDYKVTFIVSDWNMPQKTGLEFLREVRMVDQELPFIMVTARADESSVLAAIDSDVSSYVTKPFSFDALKKRVDVILAKQPQEQEEAVGLF